MSAFLQWLATVPPLIQIPVVLAAFGALIAAALVFVDLASRQSRVARIVCVVVCAVVPAAVLLFLGLYRSVFWIAGVAALAGVALFVWDWRSRRGRGHALQLIGFLAPAIVLVIAGFVYPMIRTAANAFTTNDGDSFAGLDNFAWAFTSPDGVTALMNTIIWVIVAPTLSTAIGLTYAVLIDKSRGEKVFKLLIFLPMAISFVGASVIFKFFYDVRQGQQIGILNAIVTLFGGAPIDWLGTPPWNTFFLVVVLIWTQAGFAMVLLSAAIKGVPTEQLEAISLDGANSWQSFWNIVIPTIRPTIVVVLTTTSIASLNVYDIVSAMTAGRADTTVLAYEMIRQFQAGDRGGYSAALAMILLVLVLPIIVINSREIRKQKEAA